MHSSCSLFQNVDQAYSFVSAILALSRFSVRTENMDYSQKAKWILFNNPRDEYWGMSQQYSLSLRQKNRLSLSSIRLSAQ